MKFRDFMVGDDADLQDYTINEGSSSAAFFISPRGELIDTKGSKHIAMIIKYPEKFGLEKEDIEAKYEEYGEKVGVEGKARESIMKSLMEEGWIRIRRYPNKFWVIDLYDLNKKVKDRLYDFANKILKGIPGFKEDDKFMDVSLSSLKGYRGKLTISEIAADKLFNESINNRSRYILTLKNIEDLEVLSPMKEKIRNQEILV